MNADKQPTEKSKFAIFSVMWREWILPFLIALVVSIILRVAFKLLFDSTDYFIVGWISCVAWYASREYYAT